jgi:hypothetical protein
MPKFINSYIKFYYSDYNVKDRLIIFRVNNKQDALNCLTRMRNKGVFIKAAWHELRVNGIITINERIDK